MIRHPSQPPQLHARCRAAAAAIAAPALRAQAKLEKTQGRHRRRRQGGVLLPAADDRRAAGLLQGRRPGRRDLRFRRRRARAAGAGGRLGRRGERRLRAHHQHAEQEPVHPVVRAAGPRAADRDGRVDQGHAQLQGAGRPAGQEDRRVRAGLVHQHGGQPGAVARAASRPATSASSAWARRRARWPRCARARSTP